MSYAGKVFLESPSGKQRQWVDAHEVPAFKSMGFKVAPVRLRLDHDAAGRTNRIERTFAGDRVPPMWANSESVTSVEPGQESQSTSFMRALGNNARAGAIDAVQAAPPMLASAMIPGVGAVPAAMRFATFAGVGGGSNMAGQALRGEEVDPASAFTASTMGAALGIPAEAVANYAPKWAPRMVSDVLRPTATQQKAMEAVAQRQSGQRSQPDYDRAAKDLLKERIIPDKKGSAQLESLNEKTNVSVNDILDQLDANGYKVLPTQLVRSPEIAQLRRQLRKETDGSERVKALNVRLKKFLEERATKGTPNQPATAPTPMGSAKNPIVDQFGNPVMTPGKPFVPGQPRRQRPFSANRLGRQAPSPDEGEKAVWRRGASTVNRARALGTSTDKDLEIGALMDDALARAAVRHLEGTGATTVDPENPNAQVGVAQLNDRLERRIPLKETVDEHLRRPPMTFGERMGLVRGKLPFPDAAVLRAAYNATNPNFVPRTLSGGQMVSGVANRVMERANR